MITMRSTSASLVHAHVRAVARTHCHQRSPVAMIDITTRSSYSPSRAGTDYRHRRASLRRVWLQPRSGSNAGLLSAVADGRHRVAGGLAADLRRRGRARLGGRGHHDRRIRPAIASSSRSTTCTRGTRSQLDEVEGVTSGTYQKLTVRIATLDGDVTAWVYVFDGYEGGLPTSWYLSEIVTAAERAGAPEDYLKDLRSRPTRTSSI